MSLADLQAAVGEARAHLELAGIRGIDLDYLLEPKVDHVACLGAFKRMVEGPLVRWRRVLEDTTVEQVAYLKLVEPKHPKVVAAHEARKVLKNWFKGYVLCFHKDAERRIEEEQAHRRVKNDWPLEGSREQQ